MGCHWCVNSGRQFHSFTVQLFLYVSNSIRNIIVACHGPDIPIVKLFLFESRSEINLRLNDFVAFELQSIADLLHRPLSVLADT